MIPATALFRARHTFGSGGYHQIHPLEDIKRLINANIEYSVLTSTGFKHITALELQGTERAYTLKISLLGKQYSVTTVASQTYWDFNACEKRSLLDLVPSQSGILYNTTADLRCNGMNLKLQVAEVISVEPTESEVKVFKLELQTQDPKIYIDNLESAL